MAVDGALLGLANSIESGAPWPRPRCPTCNSGHIRFAAPVEFESRASVSERAHPDFEPEWIRGTFVCHGGCENPECGQNVHATGNYYVGSASLTSFDAAFDYEESSSSTYYDIAHIHPPILLMSIPASAPKTMREGILRASRVTFADPGLAAAALRAIVERFVKDFNTDSENRLASFASAQKMLDRWRKSDPSREPVAALLFAVKWLGNAGVHDDARLSTLDVLEGAQLLDEAFHRIYTGPDLDARAQTINANKGPYRSANPD